jgi:hypothetical protein
MLSKKTLISILSVGLVLFPLIASAAAMPNLWPSGYWAPNGLVSCTGDYISAQLSGATPCTSLLDLIQTILNITAFMMSIAIFIVMPVLLVYGAVLIMMGGANPDMLSTGKKVLLGTVIGLAIILCSYLIISEIVSVFKISGLGGFS